MTRPPRRHRRARRRADGAAHARVALAALAGPATVVALVAPIMLACRGPAVVPAGSRIGPALSAALAAADQAREPWRCAAPDGPSLPTETLISGAHHWQLAGHVMTLDATGDVAIGAIADASGSSPHALAALARLRERLGRVDLVIALGGMGATEAELTATFAVLVDRASFALVAMPGDLEPAPALADAVAAARQRGAPIVDGRLVQRIELPGATIALVPGAGAASRLVAGDDGCRYLATDVAAAFGDVTQRPGLRIAASAEPPRADREPVLPGMLPNVSSPTSPAAQSSSGVANLANESVGARGAPDEPVGELAVTVSAGQQIDIALHGPASTGVTPARRGRRDGAAIQLTPGSSDALPRLDAPGRRPSAGILTVHGTAWAWTPIEDK